VFGVREGGEAVGEAVGLVDGLVEVRERSRHGDGAERLIVHDVGFQRHIGE
jgi:hypothetical protein